MSQLKIHTWYSEVLKLERIDNIKTGSALRKVRESKNISLRILAKRMEISAGYLSDLERGNRNWDKPKHNRYLRELGYEVPYEKDGNNGST